MKQKRFLFRGLVTILLLVLVNPAFAKKTTIQLSEAKDVPNKSQTILTKAWSQSLKGGSPHKRYYPETSAPVLEGSTIYVGTQGKEFYALDSRRGKVLWSFENDEPIATAARVSDGRVFFSDLGGSVICLNAGDGSLVWRQSLGREVLGQPLVIGERLFVLKGEQTVVALNTATGNVVWEKFIRTYFRNLTMRGHASMVVDGATLYLGLGDGHLYALNAGSGDVVWDKNLTLPLRTFKDIDARVVVVGDSLYVGGYFGAVYKLNKKNGAVLWMTEVATGTPVVVADEVVVAADTQGNLIGLDAVDGTRLWVTEVSDSVLSEPVLCGDMVFVSSFDQKAYLIALEDGAKIQKVNVGDGALTKPIVDDERVYLLTNSATLLALKKK